MWKEPVQPICYIWSWHVSFFECSFPWPVNILQSLVALNSWVEWLSPVWVLYAKIVIANVFIMITDSRLCSSSHQIIIILYGKHRESIRTWWPSRVVAKLSMMTGFGENPIAILQLLSNKNLQCQQVNCYSLCEHVQNIDSMMIVAAYSCDHWESERNHSWESDGWDSNYLVQRPINPGLIKDLWIMPLHPKTSEMAKKQERKVEPPGIEPRATGIPCHCSATKLQLPPATTPQRSLIRPGLIGLWTK